MQNITRSSPLLERIDGLFVERRGQNIHFCSEYSSSDVRLNVPISQYGELPFRLRLWGEKIFRFHESLSSDYLTPEEKFWVIGCSIRFLGDYVRALIEFGFTANLTLQCLDLSFGMQARLITAGDFKSQLKAACIFWTASLSKRGPAKVLPFKGRFRKYLVSLARSRPSTRKYSVAQSVLMLKKSCLVVPSTFVEDALRTHSEYMSDESQRQPPDWIDLVAGEFPSLFSRKGKLEMWEPSLRVNDFSLKSTIESTRKAGGSYGWAVRNFGTQKHWDGSYGRVVEEVGVRPPDRPELLPEYYRTIYEREMIAKDLANPFCDDCHHIRFQRYNDDGSSYMEDCSFCTREKAESFEILMRRQEDMDSYEPVPEFLFSRKVVAITEPLKVRIITLGHAFESPFWADLQKHVTRTLKPLYSNCSGKELPVHYFDHLVKERIKLEHETGEKWVFVSDDGDAATDSICQELCARSLADIIPQEFYELYIDSIGLTDKCELLYELPDGTVFTVHHKNGQLMGDRRSFVQLTTIHISVKRAWMRGMAAELGLDHKRLFDCFCVNGDDGLIIMPLRYVERYTKFMGRLWNLNAIKTQVSDQMFSLNSRLFMDRRGVAYEPPFLRFNILNRVEKCGGRMVNPLVWNELQSAMHSIESPYIWRRFHRMWKDTLDLLTKQNGNNYFLPLIVGGLGLHKPASLELVLSAEQKATFMKTWKAKNKVTSKQPRWVTTVKNKYKSPFFKEERKVSTWLPWGLRLCKLTEHTVRSRFPTSGTLKRVTMETKMVSRSVKGNGKFHGPLRRRLVSASWDMDFGPLVYSSSQRGASLDSHF